ncbi:hypothetical protein ACLB2K_028316 [Fragaria x ananassa]
MVVALVPVVAKIVTDVTGGDVLRNGRFHTPTTPKPLAVVTAKHESHVQATVICAKRHGLQIRIRSGGHDYEGLSYVSHVPFVVLDMFHLRAIHVDVADESAWVKSGATVGELYYEIAKKSKVHGFSAAAGPTVGVGGHFSGGGYGVMMRKYGLTVDNIEDAKLVNLNGTILDRNRNRSAALTNSSNSSLLASSM